MAFLNDGKLLQKLNLIKAKIGQKTHPKNRIK